MRRQVAGLLAGAAKDRQPTTVREIERGFDHHRRTGQRRKDFRRRLGILESQCGAGIGADHR
jgi:hypothetical protein